MYDEEKQDKTENQSLSRRVVSSSPGLLVFVAMVCLSVVFCRNGLSLSRVPLWVRLPFLLYSVLTVFVGLVAARPLFSTKTHKDAATNAGDAVKPTTGEDESCSSRTTSASFIVSGLYVAYSVLMFTCSAGILIVLLRFPSSFGTVGSAVFGVIAAILLIASLKWPVKVIRRSYSDRR